LGGHTSEDVIASSAISVNASLDVESSGDTTTEDALISVELAGTLLRCQGPGISLRATTVGKLGDTNILRAFLSGITVKSDVVEQASTSGAWVRNSTSSGRALTFLGLAHVNSNKALLSGIALRDGKEIGNLDSFILGNPLLDEGGVVSNRDNGQTFGG